jgi:hypothetical protein
MSTARSPNVIIEQVRQGARSAWVQFWRYALKPLPPPPRERRGERVVYGLAQPVLGLRWVLIDPVLRRGALEPATVLGLFCALVGLLATTTGARFWHTFYTTFAVLAPVPSVIFARHYARLAATARQRLGFAACEPWLESIFRSTKRALRQVVLVAIVIAPVQVLLRLLLPGIGGYLSGAVAAVWALHWVVIEALDDGRVLGPGQTREQAEAEDATRRSPWFIRSIRHGAERSPRRLGNLLRWFARIGDRLSLPWRGECALAEDHPMLVLGFALSTAGLLATPILNLLFRPTIIVAAAHVLGRLESMAAAAPAPPSAPAWSLAGEGS